LSEKIDGTNAQILINDEGQFYIGSRTTWITIENDNHGFAKWSFEHREELTHGLGPGRHFGEWWGQGIQRNYGLKEKRFSLFNVIRWNEEMFERFKVKPWMDREKQKDRGERPVFVSPPSCCHVIPVLSVESFPPNTEYCLLDLENNGSHAAPGFMKPEGIVIYHTAGNIMFKKTFEKDKGGKG
jgi:hypothetical protein